MSVVEDLVQHVANQRSATIRSALQLLEDEEDILAFLFAIVCADVCSLVNALSVHTDTFPRFARLTSAQRSIAVSSAIGSILSARGKLPMDPKALADMIAAQKEIRPRIEIVMR